MELAKWHRNSALVALVIFPTILACDSGTTPEVVVPASITLTANPNPVSSFPLPPPTPEELEEGLDESFFPQFRARFVLTMTETAGVGANIESIFAQVDQASGGIVISTGEVIQEFTIDSDTNRIEGNGSIPVNIDVSYRLPDGKSEALITVEILASDDNGFDLEGLLRVPVN
jgi:hypothetical protein